MKKAIVMAGVLFALTMTAGCGSQNQDHAATAESQTQDTASGSGTAAQSENTDQKQRNDMGIKQRNGSKTCKEQHHGYCQPDQLFPHQPQADFRTKHPF